MWFTWNQKHCASAARGGNLVLDGYLATEISVYSDNKEKVKVNRIKGYVSVCFPNNICRGWMKGRRISSIYV